MSDSLRDRVTAALGDSYEIGGELGRGGMGVVYQATDRRLKRRVAIKILPPELAFREDVRQRFLREAQTAAQLNHPHIVPIYAVEERGGIVGFVMALVDGDSVAVRLRRDRQPATEQVIRVLREVADALAYAHARGIVHRDIKPDNILFDRHSGRAMVTDFGIARAAEGDARLTVTGIAVGTPAYMSPEQALGEREIDGRSDVYSLAIVAYELLSGELPFKAKNTPSMLMKHISETPPPLHERCPDLPRGLVAVVEKAMAKKPADRWPGAAELRDALDAVAAGRGVDVAPGREERPRDEARRPPRAPEPPRLPEPERLSSTWKRPAPRDAIEAANAGWESRRGGRAPLAHPRAPAPLAPVPAWMPDSWREVRRGRVDRDRRADRLGGGQGDAAHPTGRKSIPERIRTFRQRAASSAVLVGGLAAINGMTGDFPWVIFPTIGIMFGLLNKGASLWADGVRWKDVFGKDARKAMQGEGGLDGVATSSQPTASDYARRLAPYDVLSGPFGGHVQRAAGDRMAIHEVLARLSKADKELIPDVEPTVDALAERVGSLAQALHRLDEDVRPSAIEELDRRIAAVQGQEESREREQKLQLLERQKVTMRDLLGRRDALLAQLDSASLMLQNMRLDMIALRSAGVQSALDDVSSATQEARALSRDIAHVLDAARQVR